MLGLASVGEDASGSVWKNSGLWRVASTISQKTNKDQALEESLKCLEKQVETLESKYYAVLDTFLSVTERLVRLGAFTKSTTLTEEEGV